MTGIQLIIAAFFPLLFICSLIASDLEQPNTIIDATDEVEIQDRASRKLKSFNIGWEQSFSAIVMDATGQYLSASVEGGSIYRSSDYGVHWSATSAPNDKRWTAMTSDDSGQYLTAACYPYQLYTSSNYGNSWEYYETPFNTTSCLSASSDGQQIIASTNYYGIFKSTTAGSTWTSLSAPLYYWRGVASTSDGQLLFASSIRDGIWASVNGGQDWTNTSAPNVTWNAITTDATGQHIYATESKGIWRSANFGQSWNKTFKITSNYYYYVDEIVTSSDGKYVAATASSNLAMYISSNYGVTWTVIGQEDFYGAFDPQGLAMSSSGEYIITSALYDGFIRSSDYGLDWLSPSYLVVDCPIFEVPFLYEETGDSYCENPCFYPYHPRNFIPRYDSIYQPEYHCKALNLQAPLYVLIVIIFFVTALYLMTISFVVCSSSKIRNSYWNTLVVVARTMLPTLDVVSDILFLLTASTYNSTIFALCVILFYFHSGYFIVRDVWAARDKPYMMPCFYLCHIPDRIWYMFEKVDDIAKLFVFSLLCLPFFLINCIWMLPMTMFLFFLYSSKLYAFAMCKNTWHALWSGNNDHVTRQIVDVTFFNEQTFYTSLMCSMPQFVLQLTSAILLKNTTVIVVFSLTMSLANALNTAYRSIYYRMILQMEMKDVPTVLNVLNGQEIDHRESESMPGGDNLTSSLLAKSALGEAEPTDRNTSDNIALLKVQNDVREMKVQLAELNDIKARLAALEEGTKRMSVFAIEEK